MSDLALYFLTPGWRRDIRDLFPKVTEVELDALAVLIAEDRFITDAGEPTDDLMAWVAYVSGWRHGPDPELVPVPLNPPPRPGPATQAMEVTP